MIRIERLQWDEPIPQLYYLVHKLNENGLIVATVLVEGDESITEGFLFEQASNRESDLYKELIILENGKKEGD